MGIVTQPPATVQRNPEQPKEKQQEDELLLQIRRYIKENPKQVLLAALGLIILIIIVIIVGIVSSQQTNSSSEVTPTAIVTPPGPTTIFSSQTAAPLPKVPKLAKHWKTFRNANYSFLYPPTWSPSFDADNPNTVYFLPATGASDSGAVIFSAEQYIKDDGADISDNADLSNILNKNTDLIDKYILVAGNVGREVSKVLTDEINPEGFAHYILFYKGDKKYRFSCYCHQEDKYIDTLTVMASSFKFYKNTVIYTVPQENFSPEAANDKKRLHDILFLSYDILFGLKEGTVSSTALNYCLPNRPCQLSNDSTVINSLDICSAYVSKYSASILYDPKRGFATSKSDCSQKYDSRYLVIVDQSKESLVVHAQDSDLAPVSFTVALPSDYLYNQ